MEPNCGRLCGRLCASKCVGMCCCERCECLQFVRRVPGIRGGEHVRYAGTWHSAPHVSRRHLWNSRLIRCLGTYHHDIPHSLVVRIWRSHRRGPGSIPGVGTFFVLLCCRVRATPHRIGPAASMPTALRMCARHSMYSMKCSAVLSRTTVLVAHLPAARCGCVTASTMGSDTQAKAERHGCCYGGGCRWMARHGFACLMLVLCDQAATGCRRTRRFNRAQGGSIMFAHA